MELPSGEVLKISSGQMVEINPPNFNVFYISVSFRPLYVIFWGYLLTSNAPQTDTL